MASMGLILNCQHNVPQHLPCAACGRGYEHAEAQAEIARHHRDFGRIQGILDRFDFGAWPAEEALAEIRKVVG